MLLIVGAEEKHKFICVAANLLIGALFDPTSLLANRCLCFIRTVSKKQNASLLSCMFKGVNFGCLFYNLHKHQSNFLEYFNHFTSLSSLAGVFIPFALLKFLVYSQFTN